MEIGSKRRIVFSALYDLSVGAYHHHKTDEFSTLLLVNIQN